MIDKIRSEVVCMTPEIAKAYLETNKGNRNVRPSQVAFLANSMTRGDWVLTHQGIAISKDGILIDGQHRLLAVIKANMAIPMMVTYGLDRKTAFPAIDGGFILRSDADRIGVDRKTVEVAKFLALRVFYWFGDGWKSRKFTHSQLNQICDVISEYHDELMEYCPTVAKVLSNSTARTAAISSVLIGQDKDYVFKLYRDLVLSNIDNLPQCGKSIIKQVMTGHISHSKASRDLEFFSKMMYVFDKTNADISRISIRNHLEFADKVREKLIKKFPFIEYDKLKTKSEPINVVTYNQTTHSSCHV